MQTLKMWLTDSQTHRRYRFDRVSLDEFGSVAVYRFFRKQGNAYLPVVSLPKSNKGASSASRQGKASDDVGGALSFHSKALRR